MARLNRRVGGGVYGSRSTPEIDTNFGSDPTGTPFIPGKKQIIYMGQIFVPDPATGTYQPAAGGVSQIATIDPPRANNLKTTAPSHPIATFFISPHKDGTVTYWQRDNLGAPFVPAGSTDETFGGYVLSVNRAAVTRNDPPSVAEITQALSDLGIDGPVEAGWSALIQLSDGALERQIYNGTVWSVVQTQEPPGSVVRTTGTYAQLLMYTGPAIDFVVSGSSNAEENGKYELLDGHWYKKNEQKAIDIGLLKSLFHKILTENLKAEDVRLI